MVAEIIAVAVLCAQPTSPAGPLDGFLANYHDVSVELDYEVRVGQGDHAVLEDGDISGLDGSDFLSKALSSGKGTWGSDGTTRRYQFQSETALKQSVKGPKGESTTVEAFPLLELLVDDEKEAHHIVGSQILRLDKTKNHSMTYSAVSPFHVWMGEFPFGINETYPNTAPVRSNVVRNGRPLVLEAYYKQNEYGKYFTEVYYDPNLNYLVRYARLVHWYEKQNRAAVMEHFLLGFRKCARGGLVPTGWIEARSEVPSFDKSYPSYGPNTEVHGPGTVGLVQFRTLGFRDVDHPVALTSSIKDIASIFTMGNMVSIKPPRESLTLDEIVKIAGRSYAQRAPPRPLPNIDREALHEFDRPQARAFRKSWLLVVAGGVLVSLSLIVWRRRRASSALLALAFLAALQSGCGFASKPFDSLAAEFSPSSLIFRANGGTVPVALVLKNSGNRSLRVLSIDAGCSCRQIDHAELPATIFVRAVPRGMDGRLQLEMERIAVGR